jgi:hypothetical protein
MHGVGVWWSGVLALGPAAPASFRAAIFAQEADF